MSTLIVLAAACSNSPPRVGSRPTPSPVATDRSSPRPKCAPASIPVDKSFDARLTAGTYRVTFIPDCATDPGSPAPRSFTARLELVATSKEFLPFLGWFDHGLEALRPSGFDPPATSRDPLKPGAIVWIGSRWDQRPLEQTLLVGTNFNDKARRGWTDGAGIGLFFRSWQDSCFYGVWEPYGLLRETSGHFVLCPLPLETNH